MIENKVKLQPIAFQNFARSGFFFSYQSPSNIAVFLYSVTQKTAKDSMLFMHELPLLYFHISSKTFFL